MMTSLTPHPTHSIHHSMAETTSSSSTTTSATSTPISTPPMSTMTLMKQPVAVFSIPSMRIKHTPITNMTPIPSTSTSTSTSHHMGTSPAKRLRTLMSEGMHETPHSIPSAPITRPSPRTILPERYAFDREASIERKKHRWRGEGEHDSAASTPRPRHLICPSTPMKSPSISRVYDQYTPHSDVSTEHPVSPAHVLFSAGHTSPIHTTTSSTSTSHHDPLSYFDTHFINVGEIGRGNFGVVYKVQSRDTHQYFAVKKSQRPFRGAADRLRALNEVSNFEKLGHTDTSQPHPHCVRLIRAWEEHGYLYIQTELFEQGTLANYLSFVDAPLSEPMIWSFLVDLALAIEHIHTHGLVHLDIKPDNIFLTSTGTLKIGDFGIMIHPSQWEEMEMEGDATYLAPELLEPKVGAVGSPADIFSLGMILYELAADVDLPTRGLAWRQLRHEMIDFAGTTIDDIPPPLMSSRKRGSSDMTSSIRGNSDTSSLTRASDMTSSSLIRGSSDMTTSTLTRGSSDTSSTLIPSTISKTSRLSITTASSTLTSPLVISTSSPSSSHSSPDSTTPTSSHSSHAHISPIITFHTDTPVGLTRSHILRQLICDMLHRNPIQRPTIQQILSHPQVTKELQIQREMLERHEGVMRRNIPLPPRIKATPIHTHTTWSATEISSTHIPSIPSTIHTIHIRHPPKEEEDEMIAPPPRNLFHAFESSEDGD